MTNDKLMIIDDNTRVLVERSYSDDSNIKYIVSIESEYMFFDSKGDIIGILDKRYYDIEISYNLIIFRYIGKKII